MRNVRKIGNFQSGRASYTALLVNSNLGISTSSYTRIGQSQNQINGSSTVKVHSRSSTITRNRESTSNRQLSGLIGSFGIGVYNNITTSSTISTNIQLTCVLCIRKLTISKGSSLNSRSKISALNLDSRHKDIFLSKYIILYINPNLHNLIQ